jgi:hypothetical protein
MKRMLLLPVLLNVLRIFRWLFIVCAAVAAAKNCDKCAMIQIVTSVQRGMHTNNARMEKLEI